MRVVETSNPSSTRTTLPWGPTATHRRSRAFWPTWPSCALDYDAATIYFRFLATLVDAAPISTFTTRESVVEWITDGRGHHSPVVISFVVLD